MKLKKFLEREKANGYPIIDKKDVDKRLKELDKHKCSFGFGNEKDWNPKKKDWVCSCGKTRRQHLQELDNY